MKTTILIFFTIIPVFIIGQTFSTIVSDSTILSFMKWEMKNGKKYSEASKLRLRKKMSVNALQFDSLNFVYSDSLPNYGWEYDQYLFNRYNQIDTLFSPHERNLLFEQFNSIKDNVWCQNINGAKIKKWRKPLNQYNYSIPLFTSDDKYVLIKKSFYCGSLCAYGGIFLYEKIGDNRWKLLKVINGWIS